MTDKKDKLPVMRGSFLRFPRAMREIARVSHLGCMKYDAPEGSMDYLDGEDGYGLFTDALGRHLLDEATGGVTNVETGGRLPPEGMIVLHQAQAAWNTLARLERYLLTLEERGVKVEDIFLLAELGVPLNTIDAAMEELDSDVKQVKKTASPIVENVRAQELSDFMLPQQFREEKFMDVTRETMEKERADEEAELTEGTLGPYPQK
ncbi:MAG: dATP/dGTP diphosphohydrolase domain-containing protein [Dehalococcoidia bacterium]